MAGAAAPAAPAAGQALAGCGGTHDVGGVLSCKEALDLSPEPPLAHWEKTVDAMVGRLISKGLMRVDELRRGIEALPAPQQLAYYAKWAASAAAIMREKGHLTEGDLAEHLGFGGTDANAVRKAI